MNWLNLIYFGREKLRRKRKIETPFGSLKLDEADMSHISGYFANRPHTLGQQVVADKVWNDLNGDDLFRFVDRTNSGIGQQVLYDTLRTIPSSGFVRTHEAIIDTFTTDETWREPIRKELKRLSHRDAYDVVQLFQHNHKLPDERLRLAFRICRFLPAGLLGLLLIFQTTTLLYLFILSMLINIVLHYWNKRTLWSYLHSIPQFLILLRVAGRLAKDERLRPVQNMIDQSLSMLHPLRNKLALFRFDVKLDADLSVVFFIISELIRCFFLLEPNTLLDVMKLFNRQHREIEQVYRFVGDVDMLCSIASLRAGLPYYCHPSPAEPKCIEAVDMYHPLIEACISNNFSNRRKSVILTGSNMSGKTAFIRTVAINVLTAQTIHTCFAKNFHLTPMQIFSSIQISDDLMNARSYYLQEVLTVKEMIEATEKLASSLFLLDELFKGTNTTERIAAGKAVLSALNTGNNLVLIATHDLELAELLQNEYDLYHFSEQINGAELAFDYKLKKGVMTQRNAIRILELYHYPPETVAEAYETTTILTQISK
ncbi:MutS-related protein [Microbacter margulisiae]|uniref:DNA mismatch repair proteins mutS family domain-containing protein n=1 Tax=Microbacter margulisiae TaxID=1350067 RepID=A0A7W5DTD1_9PORP|nr:DNA mismatch repair protein MutS [Microbacter margulisiae]MBB3187888.1 hypothetical protein [Microbacter margulisiae]